MDCYTNKMYIFATIIMRKNMYKMMIIHVYRVCIK